MTPPKTELASSVSQAEYNRALLAEYRLRQAGSAKVIELQQRLDKLRTKLETIHRLGGQAGQIAEATLLELGYWQPTKE